MKDVTTLLLLIASAFLFASCSSYEEEYDADAPVTIIQINIVDEQGNNLFSPEVEGNWWGQPFEMAYEGEKYQAIWESEDEIIMFSYLYPTFTGLVAWPYHKLPGDTFESPRFLVFGELNGTRSYELDLEFYVPGEEKPHLIHYEQVANYHKGLYRNVYKISLDGKQEDGQKVTLVLPHYGSVEKEESF